MENSAVLTKGKFEGKIPFITSLITSSIEKEHLRKVYLFGSYAYGVPDKDSDIDILVITSNEYSHRKAYLDIRNNFHNNRISPCDLLVKTENEFKEKLEINDYNVYNTIYNRGILLYG